MIKQLKKSNLPKINFIYSLFHKKKSFYHKKYYVLPQICAKTLNFCGITTILCLNDILSKFFKVFRKKREKFLVEKRDLFVERPKIFVLKPFFLHKPGFPVLNINNNSNNFCFCFLIFSKFGIIFPIFGVNLSFPWEISSFFWVKFSF
jgi:hypothetical protein